MSPTGVKNLSTCPQQGPGGGRDGTLGPHRLVGSHPRAGGCWEAEQWVEGTLGADLLPGQPTCQKGGQIRTQPSLTTPRGAPREGAWKGPRTAYNVQGHVLECLTFYVGVHRNL